MPKIDSKYSLSTFPFISLGYEFSSLGLKRGSISAYGEHLLAKVKIQEYQKNLVEIETNIGTFTAEKGIRSVKVFQDGASLFKALVFIRRMKLKYDGNRYWVDLHRLNLKPMLELHLEDNKYPKKSFPFLMRVVYDFQNYHPESILLNDVKISERLAWGMITLSMAWAYNRELRFL